MSKVTSSARGEQCQVRWLPVVGWENLYEVSEIGEVRSVARKVRARLGFRDALAQVLKASTDKGGYLRVKLSNGRIVKTAFVHRLVAEAFLEDKGQIIRHLDGAKLNNVVNNLAWGTFVDNEADKARHGRVPRGELHRRSVLNNDLVRSIRSLRDSGLSQLKIAATLNIKRGVVGMVIRNESWTHVE